MLFRFAGFEVDVPSRELRHRGTPVELSTRALDLLLYLIEHRDRVVPRTELLDEFWPEGERESLSQKIYLLRQALGDEPRRGRFIRTVRGLGFQFVGSVQVETSAMSETARPLAHPRAPRILIVDDERHAREQIKRVLADCDAEILEAEDGKRAIELAAQSLPDLVISDIRMPELNGLDLAALLREEVPLILYSSHNDARTAVEGLRAGAIDYFYPPLDEQRLVRTVRLALERRGRVGHQLIGASPVMRALRRDIERVAASTFPVLIRGERGTGKDLVARAVHEASPRADGPFVPVNLAAIPEGSLQSELFGHEPGALGEGTQPRQGLLGSAHGGSIYFDELADASPAVQAALVRVVEDGQVRPIGSDEAHSVDVRVIAATRRDLADDLATQRIRPELVDRLSVLRLEVPALRARLEDVPELARWCFGQMAVESQALPEEDVIETLASHDWPGNVRELLNAIRKMVVMAGGRRRIDQRDALEAIGHPSVSSEITDDLVRQALRSTDGDRARAAALLGLTTRELAKRVRSLRPDA